MQTNAKKQMTASSNLSFFTNSSPQNFMKYNTEFYIGSLALSKEISFPFEFVIVCTRHNRARYNGQLDITVNFKSSRWIAHFHFTSNSCFNGPYHNRHMVITDEILGLYLAFNSNIIQLFSLKEVIIFPLRTRIDR